MDLKKGIFMKIAFAQDIKALKRNGGGNDKYAIKKGLSNLEKHIENISFFNVPAIIAINHYINDNKEEIDIVERFCQSMNMGRE